MTAQQHQPDDTEVPPGRYRYCMTGRLGNGQTHADVTSQAVSQIHTILLTMSMPCLNFGIIIVYLFDEHLYKRLLAVLLLLFLKPAAPAKVEKNEVVYKLLSQPHKHLKHENGRKELREATTHPPSRCQTV